jgi:triphosphoribosyl-dephospho-CoA synthase
MTGNPISLFAQTACLWEVTARKPGNVHRYRDFEDVTYLDFALSAAVLGHVLTTAGERSVGELVLESVRRRQTVTASNTNLGIALLLAPLAKAALGPSLALRARLVEVLEDLDANDAALVYAAIREAAPGGLGRVPEQDVRDEPTLSLREAMALAADRDLIARQYVNGFQEVFNQGVPTFLDGWRQTGSVEEAIVLCHLRLMAAHPDSLIARKRGPAEAEEASRRAAAILEAGWPQTAASWAALEDLDAWLRAVGHTRNPGTTADLVTAALFVALLEGGVEPSAHFPWRAMITAEREVGQNKA